MPNAFIATRKQLHGFLNVERKRASDALYYPLRPCAPTKFKLKDRVRRAWKVFTGKADMLEWVKEDD